MAVKQLLLFLINALNIYGYVYAVSLYGGTETVKVTLSRTLVSRTLVSSVNASFAVNKVMWIVKLHFSEILQFFTAGSG